MSSDDASPVQDSLPPTDPATQPGILVVDDDPFVVAMQTQALMALGYLTVEGAHSGEAALARLRERPQDFHVVICDINMPSMDGIEFLQLLGASAFAGSVILLSGEGMRVMHTVQRLLDGTQLVVLGALEKPAGRAPLRALLDAWRRPDAGREARPARVFTGEDLHTAQRASQWVLHYQPVVDLRTGAFNGVEALVRWKHPDAGLLYPDSFIGLAEECGAIDALTDWVLREALRQAGSWTGQGLPLRIAINLSMETLRPRGFAQRVGELAKSAGVAPQQVTLEVTESRLMSPDPAPLENLVRLRLQRFGLSIDDFGTGHSSLVQLRDVPFTELKVDRGFVRGARHNQIIRPILEGSIGIGKRLGMDSVAEGVETEDDWHLLRGIGCDLAQGYFIGRPMPAEQIPEWLEIWTTRRMRLVGT